VTKHVVLARLMPPFVIGCVDSFRDTYAGTGMNLMQSIAVVVVSLVMRAGRALKRPAR